MPRTLELVRLSFGIAQVTMPRRILAVLDSDDVSKATRVAVRILGARNVVQSLALMAAPNRRRAGGAVDLIHAATMVVLALIDRKHRTAAALSTMSSIIFAAGELS